MQIKAGKAVVPMKMERLIGILSILLQRERITAPELAEQFEVSRRTIQRDIESLCRAGIHIATAQGAGGCASPAAFPTRTASLAGCSPLGIRQNWWSQRSCGSS